MASDRPPTVDEMTDAISLAMLEIHRDSYGEGVGEAKTYLLDELVVCVIDIELWPGERAVVDAGGTEAVKQVREGFQQVIAPTFKSAVERATGREVTAFMSHLNVDPTFAVELFRLKQASRLDGG